MKVLHGIVQGSPEWDRARSVCNTASEAPAMMGASPYTSRTELLRRKATGITPDVDEATQALFNNGHATELASRLIFEGRLGEDLFPITVTTDDGKLLASLDGVTMDGATIFEHKRINEALRQQIAAGELGPEYYWQLEQELHCAEAERVIFVASDGTEDDCMSMEYRAVPGRIDELLRGWAQFDRDLATWTDEPEVIKATGRTMQTLPALSISVSGMVTASNLDAYKEHALAVLGSINRNLQTDADFADAETTVKWCKQVEERIEATKAQVLGQTADIDAVFRAMDEVSAETRRIRLELDKLVTKEKEARKTEIVTKGRLSVVDHITAINATLGAHAIGVPVLLVGDLAAAIMGLRSLSSMRGAVDVAASRHKIHASQKAERVRANMAILAEHPDHAQLFPDRVPLCLDKAPEDMRNLVAARIREAKEREDKRIADERERIRQEELARIAREDAQRQAEADRIERETQERVASFTETPAPADPAPPVSSGRLYYGAPSSDSGAVAAVSSPTSTRTVMIAELNTLLDPIQVTADGLQRLGFAPHSIKGGARLYLAVNVPAICDAIASRASRARREFVP